MSLRLGEEFRSAGALSEEAWRKLAHLRDLDSDSVITAGAADRGSAGSARRNESAGGAIEMMQMLDQQSRQRQINELNDRLDELARASAEALREAEENLEEIRRTANRAKDGRIVFQDEDGTVYDEHGNEVSPDEIDRDNWRAGAPTWDQYTGAGQTVADARALNEKVGALQDRVHEGMTDEEIAAVREDIHTLKTEATAFGPKPPPERCPHCRIRLRWGLKMKLPK